MNNRTVSCSVECSKLVWFVLLPSYFVFYLDFDYAQSDSILQRSSMEVGRLSARWSSSFLKNFWTALVSDRTLMKCLSI
ncbi:hypothetical protein SAMN04487891_106122 [Flagellimonas taeanensis]|uniref:Uncharacterized protein n=1 Tax=Flagellimonas taeanensis TaxID=1005926 RepID=A0A1M6YY69_9FLAO|nr:hypothetical protein SAMN04487891_106122 [Allomuricauda taeanensis]SHL23055.1 hypothetical protein SAMN05216293_2998 [Allomuricauda taeanensis]